jgi:hypothetical protein
MKLTDDLKSARLIHLNGWLFLLLGLLASAGLLLESPHFKTVVLLAAAIWAFCRFYYYLFYVLERYLGKDRPYAGIVDALRFILKTGRDPN